MDPKQDAPLSADPAAALTRAEADVDPASAPTLHAPPASSEPAPVQPGTAALQEADAGFAARYQQRAVLGRGGMGEVRLCHDGRIGRDVAMKVIRPGRGSHDDARVRFLREARVQGQLEHPAVVPVYDLGRSPDGEIYFTMKRIRGVSLQQVLERLRGGDGEARRSYGRHRLLTVFSSICLAVDFAHRRGVLHRDLKPANIMLGDYGEVHVLDWGLARVAGEAEAEALLTLPLAGTAQTVAGQVLGTPGYMAPEQVRGAVDELSPRTDVYALGAILFELLTLVPLHEGEDGLALLAATLAGADARAALRCPDLPEPVPPELEALCVHATALGPGDRPPSARALQEAVERFLAGDRDLELRRGLARAHAERAAERAAQALADGGTEQERSAALQEVGRALALDPHNADAARTFLRLLARPPEVVPAEARAALLDSSRHSSRLAHRAAGIGMLALLPILPLVLWMGVRSAAMAGALLLCTLVLGAIGLLSARSESGAALARYLVPCGVLTGLVLCSRIAGVFIGVPALATAAAISFAQQPQRATRVLGFAACTAGLLVPFALEALGVLAPSYRFRSGALIVTPHMLNLPALPTQLFLLLGSLAAVLFGTLFISYLRDALEQAEQRFHIQNWQLRQLLPSEARQAVPAPSAGPHPPGGGVLG